MSDLISYADALMSFVRMAITVYVLTLFASLAAAYIKGTALYANVQYHRRALGNIFVLLSAHLVYLLLLAQVDVINRPEFDLDLWNIDRGLFLGWQPNLLFVRAVTIFEQLPAFLDRSYLLFFTVNLFVTVYLLVEPFGAEFTRRAIRAISLVWVFGGALHLAVPSAGPCYMLGLVNEPMKFEGVAKGVVISDSPEIAELRANYVQLFPRAAYLQEKAYRNRAGYESGQSKLNLLFGVAAFPSLHVAVPLLSSMLLRNRSRKVSMMLFVFAALTMLSAVVLQWHYFVDVLGGIFLAWIGWLTSLLSLDAKKAG